MNRRDLLLTCLKFINHLRENNCLDKIEIGNTSCNNCLNKIDLFFRLYEKYFGNINFDIYKEIKKLENRQNFEFSKRQLEFARLLCLRDNEIANRLIISPATAKTHILKFRQKTGTTTKASALVELIRAGVINIDEVETE